jgi:hypothetical protein
MERSSGMVHGKGYSFGAIWKFYDKVTEWLN